MKQIDLIAGARPNFMKIAPIIDALNAAETRGSSLRFRLIHTGQHYDRSMSGSFFEALGIPDPDINLEVGSGSQAEQTAAIMVRFERARAAFTQALLAPRGVQTGPSGGWTVAGYGLSQAMRLGGSLVMTRLLVPEMFGVMAIATMVTVILTLLSDIGLSQHIVQSRRLSPAFFVPEHCGKGVFFG